MAVLEAGFDDAIAVLSLPQKYHKRLRTTNSVERLHEEIRRRERVIHIFPNRESVVRFCAALIIRSQTIFIKGVRRNIHGCIRVSSSTYRGAFFMACVLYLFTL